MRLNDTKYHITDQTPLCALLDCQQKLLQRVEPNGKFLFTWLDALGVDVFGRSSLFQSLRPAMRDGDEIWLMVENSDQGRSHRTSLLGRA